MRSIYAWVAALLSTLIFHAASRAALIEEDLEQLNRRPATERQAQLEREARRDGRVVFYTTFNIADLQDVKRLFAQKYPYLKIEDFRLGHARLANKIRTEALAGRLEADVISMPAPYLDELRNSGAIVRYRAPFRNQLHDGFFDKEGWLNGIYNTAYFLQYNTKLVRPEELPKDWNDLLDPKWKGQLAIDQESYEWFASLLDHLGEERGLRFARQLAERGLAVRRGHTLLSQLVAAGEFKIVIDQYDHIAYRAVQSGSPTRYVFFNPVLAEPPNATWVARQSQRSHAAALFVDFLFAKETQQFLSERGRRMARKDVNYLPAVPANHRFVVGSREKWGPRSNDLIKMFRATFLAR
ncbi:MAG TPA: ABC transporter substrate-binding protein [Terriglobales bacterium]|nr:ABC transporter substrate-binding protein [Terriglobales bacterium]